MSAVHQILMGTRSKMGWRFRRSFRIAPGIRLNMGKSGFTSLSVGGRGATLNLGKRGVTSTVSLPGTGLSYQHRYHNLLPVQPPPPVPATPAGRRAISVRACVVGAVVLGGYLALRSSTPSSPSPVPMASVTAPVGVATASAAPVRPQAVVPQAVTVLSPPIPIRQVMTIQANVRAAPSMSGLVVRTLMHGQMVQALQTENGWTRVAEQDGEPIGWMHNSVLK